MKIEIKGGVVFFYLDVELELGEFIIIEFDVMFSMDVDIELCLCFNGGFFIGLLCKFLGGEILFINDFINLI